MLRRILSRAGLCLLILASLAMSATAFAHRMTQDDASPELLSYLSMGGTPEDICGDTGLAHHLTSACEACRISANALAPDDDTCVDVTMTLTPAAFRAIPTLRLIHTRSDISPPARGPPWL